MSVDYEGINKEMEILIERLQKYLENKEYIQDPAHADALIDKCTFIIEILKRAKQY